MSLLADAGHNLGDVVGLAFAGIANKLLEKPATSRLSYGYKKLTIVSALTNAVLLVATCTLLIAGAIEKLIVHTPVNEPIVIMVAIAGVIINGASALLFTGHGQDINLKATFLHLLGDALISIGVAVTAGIIWLTQWHWLDPLVGIAIAIIILWSTLSLLKESLKLILDGVPKDLDTEDVKTTLLTHPAVLSVHDLHIWGLSTQHTALTAHIVVDTKDNEDMTQELAQSLKTKYAIHHITLQLETVKSARNCEQYCEGLSDIKHAHCSRPPA